MYKFISKVTTAKIIALNCMYLPNIKNNPKTIWHIATRVNEIVGKGTSLRITTSKFSWNKKTFAKPGSKKYSPSRNLPRLYKLLAMLSIKVLSQTLILAKS